MEPGIWLSATGVAFTVAVAAIPTLAQLAQRHGLVDQPDGRKQHDRPVPAVGGLEILVAVLAASLILSPSLSAYWPLALGLVLLGTVGLADDALNLNSGPKFIAQIVAAGLVVGYGGAVITESALNNTQLSDHAA